MDPETAARRVRESVVMKEEKIPDKKPRGWHLFIGPERHVPPLFGDDSIMEKSVENADLI